MIFLDGTFLTGKFKGCCLAPERMPTMNFTRSLLPLLIRKMGTIGQGLCVVFVRWSEVIALTISYLTVTLDYWNHYPKCSPSRTIFTAYATWRTISEWSNTYSGACRYGEMTSNAAESYNKCLKDTKDLPITQFVDKVRENLMEWFDTRRKKGDKWNGFFCKKKEKEDFVEQYWFLDSYRKSYEKSIMSIPSAIKAQYVYAKDKNINNPATKRPPGRPKKNQFKTKGERENVNLIRCSRCKKLGHHNKKSCTAPING